MYRILKCNKDAYITSKYIAGVRAVQANTGQAGTLDLFKLYGETPVLSGSGFSFEEIELTRALLSFDLAPLQELTGSVISIDDPSFQVLLSMKDIYGGQTTPSNFTLVIHPVSKSWNEGRGTDVVSFRDKDAANWLTASVNPTLSVWDEAGANASGLLGSTDIDIVASGNLGSGVVDTTASFAFSRGDEDMLVDVTALVSASLAGILPNEGFRLSFLGSQETDNITRFVKRFGSRHAKDKTLRPKLIVKYSDFLADDTSKAVFGFQPQNIFLYNKPGGSFQNFFSGSSVVSGPNCMELELKAEKWVSYWTSSYSQSHSASINHLTRSIDIFSVSFDVSSVEIGGNQVEGYYSASVVLDPTTNLALGAFLSSSQAVEFMPHWKSTDGTYEFQTGPRILFERDTAQGGTTPSQNIAVSMYNLKNSYSLTEELRLRVFIQNFDNFLAPSRMAKRARPHIKTNMWWRIVDAFSKQVVVDFDEVATRLSYDVDGNYFDFWMSDLEPKQSYEFEFKYTLNGKDYLIQNKGFVFKVDL